MTKIIFAMYNPETDCVEVSLNAEIHVSFNCKKCNASVHLDEPSDIAYLTRLAREEPGCMPNWLPEMVVCKGMLRRWGSLIRASIISLNLPLYCLL